MSTTAAGAATRERYPPPRLTRWQIGWRYAVAIGNYLVGMLAVVALLVFSGEGPGEPSPIPPPAVLALDLGLGVVALLVIRWRRRRPLATVAVTSAIMVFSSSSSVVAIWALISLATHRRARDVILGALANMAAVAGSLLLWSGTGPYSRTVAIVVAVAVVASTAAYIAVGLFIGARRDLLAGMKDRAETAEREQELRVLQGQAVERNRIAREMHDVLAHRMSLVSMHAGALAYRTDLGPEQMREIAATIRDDAHASLTELRTVLGSLRDGTEVGEVEKPQPDDLDVEDLVAEARAGGASIDYSDHLERTSPLPTAIARHGYRIVQEALTNARKHAPGRKVELRLTGGPGVGLTILVRNPLVAGHDTVPGSGLGLVGLRERVDLSGGRMAVRADAGQFELEVWLPW